jgi:hypothetical protein
MNERIKELARQAGFNDFPNDVNGVWITDGYWEEELERFAELVRQDERKQAEKQEPVGEIIESSFFDKTNSLTYFYKAQPPVGTKLYIAPQKYCSSENNAAYEKGFVEGMAKQMHSSVDRAVNAMTKPWVGLTDDEVVACWARPDIFSIAHAIESKLKEKNNV